MMYIVAWSYFSYFKIEIKQHCLIAWLISVCHRFDARLVCWRESKKEFDRSTHCRYVLSKPSWKVANKINWRNKLKTIVDIRLRRNKGLQWASHRNKSPRAWLRPGHHEASSWSDCSDWTCLLRAHVWSCKSPLWILGARYVEWEHYTGVSVFQIMPMEQWQNGWPCGMSL